MCASTSMGTGRAMELYYHGLDLVDITAQAGDSSAGARSVFRATIKSSRYDRANNSFNIAGIEIAARGVPLLWHHDQQAAPLGHVNNFTKMATQLQGDIRINRGHASGDFVAQLVEEGDLNYVSGGFTNVKRRFVDDPDDRKNYRFGIKDPYFYIGRTEIVSSELVEVSVVNIPADKTATIKNALADMIGVNDLRGALGLPPLPQYA